jgi:MoaA/NifB/PqqE/SkfB family radical SAM enzyme
VLKERLIDYDPETGRVGHSPRQLYVEITSRCNLDCVHCSKDYGRFRGQDLPEAALEKLAPWFAQARFVNLNVTGEPMLAPSLERAIRLGAAGSAEVAFNTNATLVTDARAELLVAAGVHSIAVSIDGWGTNLRVRGVAYEKVRAGLLRLAAARERLGSATPHLAVAYTLMRSNAEELVPVLADLLPRVRLHALHLQPLVVFWENLVGENTYASPVIERVLAEARELCGRHGTLCTLQRSQLAGDERFQGEGALAHELGPASARYGCTDPFFEFKVCADGTVLGCSYGQEPGANLLDPDLDLDRLWNGPWFCALRKRLYARRFEGRCATCAHVNGGPHNQLSSLNRGVVHSRAERFRGPGG